MRVFPLRCLLRFSCCDIARALKHFGRCCEVNVDVVICIRVCNNYAFQIDVEEFKKITLFPTQMLGAEHIPIITNFHVIGLFDFHLYFPPPFPYRACMLRVK